MGERVVLFVCLALATLQVLQAMGLEKTPFPDWLDAESDAPMALLRPLSDSWADTTQWLNRLRRSYSDILQYETGETLSRMTHFVDNVETGIKRNKEQIEELLMTVDESTYMRCTRNMTLKTIQEVMGAAEEQQLRGCAVTLKTLHDDYKRELEDLSARVESQREETIYTPCLPTEERYTVTVHNRARKCFYASIQEALANFYHPTGADVLRTVTEYRNTIAQARDEVYACATASNIQSITQDLQGIVSCLEMPSPPQRVRRGFGKKFKKLFKKAKKGIKKVCSKVPCKIGYSVAFG